MSWVVEFEDEYEIEFDQYPDAVKTELLARARILQQFGPGLGRPNVDMLYDSDHSNMKELRFNAAGGAWRIAFAFDPNRTGILLCGGDKQGADQKRFYEKLVRVADRRYRAHLQRIR